MTADTYRTGPSSRPLLILGANGMFGHRVAIEASRVHTVVGTIRRRTAQIEDIAGRYGFDLVDGLDATDPEGFETLITRLKPAVVVNAIGIVKQSTAATDPVATITVNALFPQKMAMVCHGVGSRFIHISTDCVFSGTGGPYRESDPSDAADLYGRSKALGEPVDHHALTLRTSIIGHELGDPLGLLAWALSQRGRRVRGFRGALFSGLTTLELAHVVLRTIETHEDLEGIWHVAGEAISKYDLLLAIDTAYDLGLDIVPDDEVRIDRRLDSTAFRERTGYVPPPWPALLKAMRAVGETGTGVVK